MTFQFVFYGGPLDGFRLAGCDDDPPKTMLDVGQIAFRHSEQGRIGAVFNTFDPLILPTLPSPRPAIRLHTYRVTDRYLGKRARLQIRVNYVGPSEQMLPAGPGALQSWAFPHRSS